MHGDLFGRHSHGCHLRGKIMAHREQPRRLMRGLHHLRGRKTFPAPEGDVAPARLDRERQAQFTRDDCGGGAIGEEELRIDEGEGRLGMEHAGQRQHGPRDGSRIAACADARDQGEVRAVDGDAAFLGHLRQLCESAVAAQRQRGQADGVHHRHPPVPALRQRLDRARDEGAEPRVHRVGIERREDEDVLHACLSIRAHVKAFSPA